MFPDNSDVFHRIGLVYLNKKTRKLQQSQEKRKF